MPDTWTSWAQTDVGTVRTSNEDTYVSRPEIGLWMVADGAGGHEHGEVASGMLADMIGRTENLAGSDLITEVRNCVSHTHQTLRAQAEAEAEATGLAVTIASTIVVFLASGAHYACLWAGDSRIYRLRDGDLTQLTRDHSLVQILVDEGALTPEQAENHPHANVITRAIGADGPEPELDKVTDRALPGDRFLLCSDGLNKALSDSLIGELTGTADPARRLIEVARDHGVRDNVTVIVLQFGPAAAASTAADEEDDDDATLMRRPS